jgi:hypothetical protein
MIPPVWRNGRKPKPFYEECRRLSIVDVAREGLLTPRSDSAAMCKTLREKINEEIRWVPIRAKIGEFDGVCTFGENEEQVRVVRMPVKTRHRYMWYWDCPGILSNGTHCRRLARILFLPDRDWRLDIGAQWLCRHCTGFHYPRGEQTWKKDHRNWLADMRRSREDMARDLKNLDEFIARASKWEW